MLRVQALLIPRHINTLLLTSTKAGSSTLPDIPSYASLRMFGLLTSGMIKTPQDQVALVAETLFPKDFLDETLDEAEGGDKWKGKKRREMVEAVSLSRKVPLRDRFRLMCEVFSRNTRRISYIATTWARDSLCRDD